jgi:hypothetical protein
VANNSSLDIGNRRLRFLAYAQVQKIHDCNPFGINNQTFIVGRQGHSGTDWIWADKKPGLFFHDAWNEYAVVLPQKEKKFSMSWVLDALLHGIIQQQ